MKRKISNYLGVIMLFLTETIGQILYVSKRIAHDKIVGSFIDLLIDVVRSFGFIKLLFFLPIYLIFHISADNSENPLKVSFQHACIYLLISLFMMFLPWGNPSRGYDFLINFSVSFTSCWLVYKLKLIKK
jgi:hypothetical protein